MSPAIRPYRVLLEQRQLAPSTINQHLSSIRALADEYAESGLLDPTTAAAIVASLVFLSAACAPAIGTPATRPNKLLRAPPNTLMGVRDRSILGLLIGRGLRRDDLANLTFAHLRQRDNRWVLVDMVGKGRLVRRVPVPG